MIFSERLYNVNILHVTVRVTGMTVCALAVHAIIRGGVIRCNIGRIYK